MQVYRWASCRKKWRESELVSAIHCQSQIVRFVCFILLITGFTPAFGADDRRDAALAGCATLSEPQERMACEATVKRMAHCIGMEPEQRRQCIRETKAPAQSPERCANSTDRARCERRQAVSEVCGGQSGPARSECERAQRPETAPNCAQPRGERRVECELYREAALACSTERGQTARDCIDARWAVKLLQVHFNPLDCDAEPTVPGLMARCAARKRVLKACAGLGDSERGQCQRKFLPRHLETPDCNGSTDPRGSCLFHNRQLEVCRGMEGTALDGCVSKTATQRHSAAIDCSLSDLNPVERRYCNAYDLALAQCMGHFNDVLPFRSCVDDAIPGVVRLAAIAAGLRRIGPVH